MSATRLIVSFAVLAATAVLLSGCPSLGPRAELPPSVDRADELERAGDGAGAGRVLEQLAAQNSGADRNTLLLRAARDYLGAHRAEDAAHVLNLTAEPLTPEQGSERSLSLVELALERGQGREAWQQLSALPEPRGGAAAARYRALRARAAQSSGGVPAQAGAVEETGPHIALLLPITGRAAGAALSVREGFMTAFYQTAVSERPRVRIYDTGTQSVPDALTQASQRGADFIVGPLTREEVIAAADFTAPHAPVLALNFLPGERAAPAQFYQYALSPEDEARLAARRILEDHHRRGVALVPAGDWGERVLGAFKQELQAGGGDLIGAGVIDASRTDFSGAITDLLHISDSQARLKRLESSLGTKLQFEPRRRGDIEFIFAAAPAPVERLLRPQLRFHYAGDIPTYATSDAFEPDVRANQDLDGLMFPDMPWMLGGDLADAVHAATRDAWPSGGPYRGRLFAFGFDAFRLAQALRHRGAGAAVSVDGLTGHLSLDAERRVRRDMAWAQLHNGELHLLAPADGG